MNHEYHQLIRQDPCNIEHRSNYADYLEESGYIDESKEQRFAISMIENSSEIRDLYQTVVSMVDYKYMLPDEIDVLIDLPKIASAKTDSADSDRPASPEHHPDI